MKLYSCSFERSNGLKMLTCKRSSSQLLVAYVALGIIALSSSGASCPISYSDGPSSRPIIMGGMYDLKCETQYCRPRGQSQWSEFCKFDRGSWSNHPQLCQTSEQVSQNINLIGQARNNPVLPLKPCDFFPYIRGRTLWLVGYVPKRFFFGCLVQ